MKTVPDDGSMVMVPHPEGGVMVPPRPLGIPTGLCQSGHWWLYVEGAVGGFQRVNVNGQVYEFPTGEWFCANNSYFTAARNSHLRMMWLDGPDVMEKTFAPITNEIGERPASRAPERQAGAADYLTARVKTINTTRPMTMQATLPGPLIEHEG